MSDDATYAALNELLINVGRSLLQYVGESWPWTEAGQEAERQKIEQLVRQQKQQVAQLADLLYEADWPVDFGTYPTEYTDLHYIALDYLMDLLIQNQSALVEDAKRTLAACQDHPEAKQMVGEILAVQQSIVHELETLKNEHGKTQTT